MHGHEAARNQPYLGSKVELPSTRAEEDPGTDKEHPPVYEASELIAGAAHFLEDQKGGCPERDAFIEICAKYMSSLKMMYDSPADLPKFKILEHLVAGESILHRPKPVEEME